MFQNFNGCKYYQTKNGYFFSGKTLMHRDIWEYHNGTIPEGMVVHHIDHNRANNAIENLQLLDTRKHGDEQRGKNKNSKRGYIAQCPICGEMFYAVSKKKECCGSDCARTYYILRIEELKLKKYLARNDIPFNECYVGRSALEVWWGRKMWFTGKPSRP